MLYGDEENSGPIFLRLIEINNDAYGGFRAHFSGIIYW